MDIFEIPEHDKRFVRFELINNPVIEIKILSKRLSNNVFGLRTLIRRLKLDLTDFFAFAV